MLILPIGHEQEATRRLPWVTFGVMIACVVAFVLTGFGANEGWGEREEKLQAAFDYFMAHPYLDLDPEAEEMMLPGKTGHMRAAFKEGLRANVERPPAEQVAREQAELNRLFQDGLGKSPGPLHRWGLVPAHPSVPTWITHMFLHVGWLHLIGNLFMLYLTGPFLEDVLGRPLFAALYLLSGMAAALTFTMKYGDIAEPLVGASGAIAGVMGAFMVRYWRTRAQFFYALGFFIRGTFWAPTWLMLGLWLVNQVFMAHMADSLMTGGGVAYLAHVGGFVFGMAAALALRRLQIEERYIQPKLEEKVLTTHVANAGVERALEVQASGDLDQAFRLLTEELRVDPRNADAVLALWQVTLEQGRPAEAAPWLLGLIKEELRTGQADLAVEHWLELAAAVPAVRLDATLLVRLAPLLAARARRSEGAEAIRRALLEAGSAMSPAMAMKIASIGVDLDPKVAKAALSLVLARPDVDPADRREAESLLASLKALSVSTP